MLVHIITDPLYTNTTELGYTHFKSLDMLQSVRKLFLYHGLDQLQLAVKMSQAARNDRWLKFQLRQKAATPIESQLRVFVFLFNNTSIHMKTGTINLRIVRKYLQLLASF